MLAMLFICMAAAPIYCFHFVWVMDYDSIFMIISCCVLVKQSFQNTRGWMGEDCVLPIRACSIKYDHENDITIQCFDKWTPMLKYFQKSKRKSLYKETTDWNMIQSNVSQIEVRYEPGTLKWQHSCIYNRTVPHQVPVLLMPWMCDDCKFQA